MEPKANTWKDWLKKWWLWIVAGATILIFIISRLIPTVKGKPEVLQKAKEGADTIKTGAGEALTTHNKEMTERKEELEKIKSIPDQDKRMQALADYANRHPPR